MRKLNFSNQRQAKDGELDRRGERKRGKEREREIWRVGGKEREVENEKQKQKTEREKEEKG